MLEESVEALKCLPYIVTNAKQVVDVSYAFIDLTKYKKEDFLDKPLEDVFKLLKIRADFEHFGVETEKSYYLFTRSYEARAIRVLEKQGLTRHEKIYFFCEKLNSRVEDKFQNIDSIFSNSKIGMGIFSVPDLILLKANDQYLEFFDVPYNKN